MRAALVLVCLTMVAACTPASTAPPRPLPSPTEDQAAPTTKPRPNVVIVITDDQRADQTLRVMPKTRRWFGQGGTRFTQAFATTPLCCPARASVLSGRFAHNHRVHTNYNPYPLDERATIVRYLARAGYRSAIVGKYLNSWDISKRPGYFERWAIEDEYQYRAIPFNVDGDTRVVHRYSTTFVGEQALRYIREFERTDRKPFFLYVAPLAAHEPFTPEPRFAHADVPARVDGPAFRPAAIAGKPPWIRANAAGPRWTELLPKRQLRTLKSVDEMVGELFDELARLDELENTIAFFLSDNGYLWGEFGVTEKRLPYTPSARIPLLVRWPEGVIDATAVDDRLVANIDVAPTILDLARVPLPRHVSLDGRSLLAGGERDELLLEYFRDRNSDVPSWSSLRGSDHQYVEYYDANGRVIFREYFDLMRDPHQVRNLLADGNVSNDPDVEKLSRRVRLQRRCEGAECL